MVRRLARINFGQEEYYTLISYSRHSGPLWFLNHFQVVFSLSDQPIPEALRGKRETYSGPIESINLSFCSPDEAK